MKKDKKLVIASAATAVGFVGALLFGLISASPANATTGTTIPVSATCLSGWYVNLDEGDRIPTPHPSGLRFVGNDLVHHATNIPLADLTPGTFVAAPAPSLDSFFSVEILNGDATGYATLRHDSLGWFIGGPKPGTFSDHLTNPADFIGKTSNWGTIAADSHVISFGVGYVNTPNNGTFTQVKSVTFNGQTYDMRCMPIKTHSPKPTSTKDCPSSSIPTTSAPVTTGAVETTGVVQTTSFDYETTAPPVATTGAVTITEVPTPQPAVTTMVPAIPVSNDTSLPVTGGKAIWLVMVGLVMVFSGIFSLTALKKSSWFSRILNK